MADVTAKLAEALRDIVEPLEYMERTLPDGYTLNGVEALRQINTREFYVRIAREALAAYEQAQAEPVHQWRYAGCTEWFDGHPDTDDRRAVYETRTMFAAPAAQAAQAELEELVQAGWVLVEEAPAPEATPAQAQQAGEPTCFGAGDVVRLRAAAMAVFDGPECPQIARDVIEWYHSSLLVEVCDAPAPAQRNGAAWQCHKCVGNGLTHATHCPLYDRDEARTTMAATPAPAPQGWKLVPVEPTKEMIVALLGRTPKDDSWIEGYREMLAAAPGAGQGKEANNERN